MGEIALPPFAKENCATPENKTVEFPSWKPVLQVKRKATGRKTPHTHSAPRALRETKPTRQRHRGTSQKRTKKEIINSTKLTTKRIEEEKMTSQTDGQNKTKKKQTKMKNGKKYVNKCYKYSVWTPSRNMRSQTTKRADRRVVQQTITNPHRLRAVNRPLDPVTIRHLLHGKNLTQVSEIRKSQASSFDYEHMNEITTQSSAGHYKGKMKTVTTPAYYGIPHDILDGIFAQEEMLEWKKIAEDKKAAELRQLRAYTQSHVVEIESTTVDRDTWRKLMTRWTKLYLTECSYIPFLFMLLISILSLWLPGLPCLMTSIFVCLCVSISHLLSSNSNKPHKLD